MSPYKRTTSSPFILFICPSKHAHNFSQAEQALGQLGILTRIFDHRKEKKQALAGEGVSEKLYSCNLIDKARA